MSSYDSSLGRRKRGSQSPLKKSTLNTGTTKATSPYDANFQQHLINYNIYPPLYTYPDGSDMQQPANMDEIKQILRQRRPSLSPSQCSDGAFKSFLRADTHAAKEAQVMARVIPIIEGELVDHTCSSGHIPFNNLDQLTDGSLVAGNPDLYYGARPEQLQLEVRKQLSGKIEPSAQDHLPIVPNFFLHVKGPDGNLTVGSRQACYDGALGARGVHCLQSYGQAELQYDNNAYTLTCTYHGGTLKMYTTHPIPPSGPGNKTGFAMTQIKTWGMTGDADTFREGVAAYRNGRDWAKRQRDNAITQANERQAIMEASGSLVDNSSGPSFASGTSAAETVVTSRRTTKHPGSPGLLSYESETSADEMLLDMRPPVKRPKSHSPRKR
ncbi:uncharacterized protein MAM_07137 [Metarhizium album ARSEF 1941]|uniref:Uncharacterized protein n=1 Tax=Metarhizium album (strain ARSEF 1941) TaxID=1081103 RepID=A0A0B2WPJ3_METAS|nr:uncharacterized protein MAM_07137 [Metarhizium album ARSEF 1941]KHN94910.1 hypothetical protein MAM_07137 [Metarhizium album ARSEF 1941]